MRFLGYITKGLGKVSKKEIIDCIPEVEISRESDKYIIFDCKRKEVEKTLKFKTLDDVHKLLSFQEHDSKPDDKLIVQEFPFSELEEARELIASLREVDETFSLTVSRYRNSKVDLDKLEKDLANHISRKTGWSYSGDDHSNFDIRVHIEFKNVLVSARLGEKPLYYRSYRECGRQGALRPSIAAALCKLANPEQGDKLVDNFCGAGTILCEGKLQGLEPFGGDIDNEAVECAHTNLRELSPESIRQVKVLDAKSTDWPDNYFDLAVSNLPWGKQVSLNAVELYSNSISEYGRILKDQGKIVLLCKKPDLAGKHLKKNFPDYQIGRLRLGFLGQKPWLIYAQPPGLSLNITEYR